VSEPYNCPKCGLWCSGIALEHVCQDEQDRDHVATLEQQVSALRTLVLKLWHDHYGIKEPKAQPATGDHEATPGEWEATPDEWDAALVLLKESE